MTMNVLAPAAKGLRGLPLLSTLLSWLLLAGCGILGGTDVGQRTAEGGTAGHTITVDELDQITKSFADRYVLLLANACDEIKARTSSPEQRRNAHRLKLSGATAVYDAATGPDPVKQLVDLVVIVELQKLVWVDDGQAARFFGAELGGRLSTALVTADEEIWRLCARAMRPEQMQVLAEQVQAWRRSNPALEWTSNIRFDVVAGGAGDPLVEGILGTLSAPSGAITDSVGQARLLGQRVFYYFKRLPILLDWQIEAASENVLAVPEADRIVDGASRVLESAASVIARLDALAAPMHEGEELDPRIREIHQLLAEGKSLAASATEAAAAFAELRKDRPLTGAGTTPFDIHEYTTASMQFTETIREATLLIHEARGLAESETAVQRVQDVLDATARESARQRRETIDHAAWRAAQLVAFMAALFLLCTVIRLWLRRRARNEARQPGP
jgi:hypothetical protein